MFPPKIPAVQHFYLWLGDAIHALLSFIILFPLLEHQSIISQPHDFSHQRLRFCLAPHLFQRFPKRSWERVGQNKQHTMLIPNLENLQPQYYIISLCIDMNSKKMKRQTCIKLPYLSTKDPGRSPSGVETNCFSSPGQRARNPLVRSSNLNIYHFIQFPYSIPLNIYIYVYI